MKRHATPAPIAATPPSASIAAVTLKLKRLSPDSILPVYATDGSACFDVSAIDDGTPMPADPKARMYRTGWAFGIPHGYRLSAYSRSGHGHRLGGRLVNCVGIIDADYTGELLIMLRLDGNVDMWPRAGERIAQVAIEQVIRASFQETDDLDKTARGSGGFGSTGTAAL